ncbi:branched-chain amino acid ABC transporter permease/ATP-binding protein [Amycolatopsis sp. GM8]|uniref:branched-chain amino acid ABC transporter permease/ATP-binding protein n=1 Tax=Amycolatopsis sp. GM8 TaxID=2896530 RepID=UPI001F01A922|nr:branched-chain amino acid ABC transporter permease/ATP-binding protein [Amycolatopsis sp. GM8]
MLSYIVIGIVLGSVYSLAGIGLVLTHRTSGVFNFAHGSLATVAAFVFYTLHVSHHLAWPLAAAVAILVAGPVMGYVLELLTRSLPSAPLAVQVTTTVGIVLIVEASVSLIYGTAEIRTVPQFLPEQRIDIGSTVVTTAQLIMVVFVLLASIGLFLLFTLTRTGLAMRAVVDDPGLLDLAGRSPARARRWGWSIGVTFAAASGVAIAPLVPLDGQTLTLLVVQAFGAAAVGSFTSLPRTYLGGLAIGVASSLCTMFFPDGPLSGLPSALPFVVLFLVLLLSPKRVLGHRTRLVPPRAPAWRMPGPVQATGGLALVVLVALAPLYAGFHLADYTLSLAYVILFLALGLLTRLSGQVSLGHVTFMAIGVCAFTQFTNLFHLPWGVTLVLASIVAIPVGALLAVPAIRLSGLYLALATFGFAVVVTYLFFPLPWMFGNEGATIFVERPGDGWLASDEGYFYLVLGLVVLVALLVTAVTRSRLGRLLGALNDSVHGLEATGVSVNIARVLVFCLSAFLAAFAGVLGGAGQQAVTAASYGPLLSLTIFVLVVINPGSSPWYAVIAAAGIGLVPSYLDAAATTDYLNLLFGLGAATFALVYARQGHSEAPKWVRRFQRARPAKTRAATKPVAARPRRPGGPAAATPVEVVDVRVRFGGLKAVDGVSLAVPANRITGLIGPNGAGKTTTFNATCGIIRPSSGRVLLDGRDLGRAGLGPRARRGLGRTFQQMALFESRTVRENVALGVEGAIAGNNPLRHVWSTRADKTRIAAEAEDAIALCDLGEIADRVVGSLSTGQRRLVELARCLAGPFHVLLLDEPSAGLDRVETARFGDVIERVVREREVAVLLVEHDISLVSRLCSYLYVLDFGCLIAEGPPAEILTSSTVRAAYLGDAEVEGHPPAAPAPAGQSADATAWGVS